MDATAGRRTPKRGIERRIEPLLGPIAAGLLAAASGFFCFAMPAALVHRVIDPAAIGGRLPLALIVAAFVGIATWLGFISLDRAARPRVLHIGAPEGEADAAPVLRRADAHPDAPPRRPIFAGSDLGTPLDLIDPLPIDWQAAEIVPPPPPEPLRVEAEDAVFEPIETLAVVVPPPPVAVAPPPSPAAIVLPAPVVPRDPLPAMMARLEAGLARKALVLAGAEANVTALRREIRPIGGTLSAAVEELRQRTAGRR